MNKRILTIFLVLISFVIAIGASFALEVEVTVKLNDQQIKSDQKNLLIEDRVFVLARFVTEALNGKIDWIEETREVTIALEDTNIKLAIDSDIAYVNGNEYKLDSRPFIREGRTYIPVRFVSENLNCAVQWIPETFTVDIKKEGLEVAEDKIEIPTYTDEDLLWLSRIVQVETSDSSLDMKLGVANVVLNRVKSKEFPNSVYDVIYQIDVYKQFPPAHKDSFKTMEPSYLSKVASKKALEGINNVEDCLFFNNQPFKGKADDLFKKIDGEYFYK